MNKFFNALKIAGKGILAYLKDWRNWLVHGLIGIGLVLAAIFVPVAWWIKVIFFVCVIGFNSARMVLQKKRKQKKFLEANSDEQQAQEEKTTQNATEKQNDEEITEETTLTKSN